MSTYGSGLYGSGLYGGSTATAALAGISPTSLTVGAGPVSITFSGAGTSWATGGPPTITVSAGLLGALTVTSNTAAHATYTPPGSVRTVTFTDVTDSSTTAILSIVAAPALTGIAPAALLVGSGPVTLLFTGTNTTWLSVGVPTITVSAGSLGTVTATSDTSAHAVFTPPVVVGNVVFTDTTDGSTTATVTISVFTPIVIPAQVPGMGPVLVVEVSFGTNPNDPPMWIDITNYVQGTLTINRGRQRELDQIQAGTMACVLDNRDRRFDVTFTTGPYFPNVRPMRRIRARATYNGSNYPLFSGYVQSWGQQWTGWQDATVPITASDAFLPLNLAQLNTAFPSETSDQRVNDVLSTIGWTIGGPAWTLGVSALGSTAVVGPTGDRVISPGLSTLQPSTLANTSALQHLQDVTATEMGFLFTDRDGAVNFHGRSAIVNTTSQGTFGEGQGEMPYVDVEMLYDDTLIFNDIELTRVGGIQQSAQDTTSQTQYYLRTLSNTSVLNNSDNETFSLATALLGKYAQPTLQISAMTLDGWADPSNIFPHMLGHEIGDRVTVRRRPPGGGQMLEQVSTIQGIAITYVVEGGDWTTTWRLTPADTLNYWTLNDSVLSVLGSTTHLFF